MGKPTRKIIERLNVLGQPTRYIVTNTEKIVLVTYDVRVATLIADSLAQQQDIKKYYVKIS